MTERTVLVTGATGFVGRSIASRLHEEGWRVRAAARRPEAGPWDEFVPLDITAPATTWPVQGADAVVHAAGLAHDVHGTVTTAVDHERVNAHGAENAALACRLGGCAQLVLISSVKVMAEKTPERPLTEADACRPTTPYGVAKLRGEHLAAAALEGADCRLAILRLTPVYGAGSKGNVTRLISATSKQWLPLLPAETGARSMVHVDDVASFVATALSMGASETFIVDDGLRYNARAIQERVRQELHRRSLTVGLPSAPFRLAAGVASRGRRFALLRRLDADLSRLLDPSLFDGSHGRATLDWLPARTLWQELPSLMDDCTRGGR